MKYLRLLLLGIFFFNLLTTLKCQKIIAFNKSGKVKRIRYYEGDVIKLKTISNLKYKGVITQIEDSVFSISGNRIALSEVKAVFNTQKNIGFNVLYRFSIKGATAYLPLIATNRVINDEGPLIQETDLIVCGSFLGIALISRYFSNKRYRISKKRPLMIINLSI